MKVIISGLAGSGKSTLMQAIAKEFGLEHIVAGDVMKNMAEDEGYNPTENWWETEKGMEFLNQRENNPEFDKELDRRLKKRLNQGNIVITSWTMPWLYEKESYNIWLEASQKERGKRIAGRDNISEEEALKKVKKRDRENKKLYKDIYGIELGQDLGPFDKVIKTEKLSIEETKKIAIKALSQYKKKLSEQGQN